MLFESWENRTKEELLEPEAIAKIEGAASLIQRFGEWPTFEDAEVLVLNLDRGNHWWVLKTGDWSKRIPPSLEGMFYVFDNLKPADSSERKPTKVNILFEDLDRIVMEGFNHQNPIVGIGIQLQYSQRLKERQFRVDWGGTGITHEVSFTCGHIKILSIEPLDAKLG